jgi:hypothetical protein
MVLTPVCLHEKPVSICVRERNSCAIKLFSVYFAIAAAAARDVMSDDDIVGAIISRLRALM